MTIKQVTQNVLLAEGRTADLNEKSGDFPPFSNAANFILGRSGHHEQWDIPMMGFKKITGAGDIVTRRYLVLDPGGVGFTQCSEFMVAQGDAEESLMAVTNLDQPRNAFVGLVMGRHPRHHVRAVYSL